MYMLQEIDILEDWTAIKKVGLMRASATLTQGRGWQCSARCDTSFGLCRLSSGAFKGSSGELFAQPLAPAALGPGFLPLLPAHKLPLNEGSPGGGNF